MPGAMSSPSYVPERVDHLGWPRGWMRKMSTRTSG